MEKKLTANLGLKVMAFFFAVALWFIVVNINDPVDRAVFRGIPVEIQNQDVVAREGKTYEILDDSDVIDVTVWANRSILDSLRRENIVAVADMEEININDTLVRIRLSTNRHNDRIEKLTASSDYVNIKIEDLVRKQLYITATASGEPLNGYVLGDVVSEQNLVRISGPKSIVDTIERAEAHVDVTELSKDIRTDAGINLYNTQGQIVNDEAVKKNIDVVALNVEILKTASVPIEVAVTGVPAEGFSFTGLVETNPSSVLIAGDQNSIDKVRSVFIPEGYVNVNGALGNYTASVDIKGLLPEGIILAGGGSSNVDVTVYIERLTTADITLDAADITFDGVPEGFRAELSGEPETIRMRVRGLPANLSVLPNVLIGGSVNIADYMRLNSIMVPQAGTYTMPVVLNLPEGIRQDSIETVSVRLIRES